MGQHIRIFTLDGAEFDTFPNTNIEFNGGGESIVSPEIKTKSYTNAFDLPVTPSNQSLLLFSSNVKVSSRPILDVVFSCDLYSKKGKLTVLTTDERKYSCSFSENIENQNYNPLLNDCIESLTSLPALARWTDTNSTMEACIENVSTELLLSTHFAMLHDNTFTGTHTIEDLPVFINLYELITTGSNISVITDGISDADLMSTWLYARDFKFVGVKETSPSFKYTITIERKSTELDGALTFVDLFEATKEFFNVNYIFEDDFNAEFVSLSNEKANATRFENFTNIKKEIFPTVIPKDLYIDYVLHTSNSAHFGGDVATGGGVEDKTRTLNRLYIPQVISGNYKSNDAGGIGKFLFAKKGDDIAIDDTDFNGTFNKYFVQSLSGVYSSILNPIYATIYIIEADIFLLPLDFLNIKKSKYINSLQLGGVYFVDSLAYNLISKIAHVKLIKV